MRVINVKNRQQLPEPKRKRRMHKPVILALVLAITGVGLYSLLKAQPSEAPAQNAIAASASQNITEITKKGTLKIFTGLQFKDLYNSFAYPNTAPIDETTPITGDETADAKIREIAVSRGYQLRSAPVTNAFQDVGSGYMLQQRAAQPWLDLVAAAKKDGISIGLTAAYRSAEEQKQIFNERLSQLGIPVSQIAAGTRDTEISQVLRMTAIPGYSRHHTGYTVDISCEDMPTTSFMYTTCFDWLSATNYEHAKTFGWIPSYPEGSGAQGPDPESWEYVWVGKDALID